jgi:hypothetical protein
VRSDGTGWCWGYNYYGQLGDLTGTNRTTPVRVVGVPNFVDVAAGGYHTCAPPHGRHGVVLGLQRLRPARQRGTPPTARARMPVPGLSGVVELSAGFNHTCARLSSGALRCWGYNGNGQLGDGTSTTRYTPVAVSGISTATQVAASDIHTCARLWPTARCAAGATTATARSATAPPPPALTPVAVSGVSTATHVSGLLPHHLRAARGRDGALLGRQRQRPGRRRHHRRPHLADRGGGGPLDATDLLRVTPGTPGTAETCNGVDDNCDGVVDNVAPSTCNSCTHAGHGACTVGVGACARTGTLTSAARGRAPGDATATSTPARGCATARCAAGATTATVSSATARPRARRRR